LAKIFATKQMRDLSCGKILSEMKITTLTNPRQTVLVTCRFKRKDNIITMDWHMPLSFNPMMYAIAVGKTRFSCGLIKNSGVFGVNFMGKEFEKAILYCGKCSGRNLDKFSQTGLEKKEAEKIDCPKVKQALGFLECKVVKEVEVGGHILFIAEIANSDLKIQGKRLFHLWGDKFTTTKE
jgi:flavin reductase (DIM6/NTAB) family NADH-FMN oxidoreductase RutF